MTKKILSLALFLLPFLGFSQNCSAFFTAFDSVNCTVFFYPQTQPYPVYWSIDFGDNTSQTQSNATTFYPTHQYAQNGTYVVSLMVYSSNTCYDTFSTSVTVNSCSSSSACQVYMSNQISLCTGTFNATANTANNTYTWDFGDNTTGTGSTVTHTYATPGLYTVCVISLDANGCSDTLCQAVTIQSCTQSCDASFGVADSLCDVYVYSLGNYSTPMSWYWDFGDNTYMTHYGNSSTGTHTYAQSGTYTICLSVWDSVCADTFCQTITVNCNSSNCTPDFSYQIYQCTAYYYVVSPVNTANYYWDFGDNFGTGSGTSPTYVYAQNGTYNVCLTMYDSANNCYGTYCEPVTITGCSSSSGPCDASFSVYVDSMNPCSVTVLTVGQNYPMNYYVNFGDGNDDYTLNYYYGNWTNTYTGSGPWNICVTIWDSSCADTVCQTIVLQGCGPNSIQDNSNITTPKVTVSPAPFRDVMEIQVTHSEMVDHITVFDLSGKAQLSEQVNGRSLIQLNTSALAEGMYLLEIKEVSGKQQLKKIVKQ
jgi:PKD repeat protein